MNVIYQSLESVSTQYDAFLIDQFGVLIDGAKPYPCAPASLKMLSDLGKDIIILSNSGKRAMPNIKRLVDLGFDRTSFKTVLSSGEIAFRFMQSEIGARLPLNAHVFLLSRDGDKSAIKDLPLIETQNANDADLLLISGIEPWENNLRGYKAFLKPFLERGVVAICSNPDQNMLTPKGPAMAAGRVARLFEEMGGAVEWIGKPFPLIYKYALDQFDGVERSRILCIGDSLEHDIIGGQNAQLSTALVRTGIHEQLPDEEIAELCAAYGAQPKHFINSFKMSRDV